MSARWQWCWCCGFNLSILAFCPYSGVGGKRTHCQNSTSLYCLAYLTFPPLFTHELTSFPDTGRISWAQPKVRGSGVTPVTLTLPEMRSKRVTGSSSNQTNAAHKTKQVSHHSTILFIYWWSWDCQKTIWSHQRQRATQRGAVLFLTDMNFRGLVEVR